MVLWKAGKASTWNATIVDTHAASYLNVSPVLPSQVAEAVADRKKAKYSTISTSHWFIPVAVETMGPINQEGFAFFEELGNRIAKISEDSRERTFLHQRISIIIQRFNSIAFRRTFIDETNPKG